MQHKWEKQASMKQASSPPNYSKAKEPNHSCAACAFFDNESKPYCTKYSYTVDPSYWCSSWESRDLDMQNKVARAIRNIKSANPNQVTLSPSQLLSPGTSHSLPPVPGIRMPGSGQIRGNHPGTKKEKKPVNVLPMIQKALTQQ